MEKKIIQEIRNNILLSFLITVFPIVANALEPVPPPEFYASGPLSPFESTNIFASERSAFALLDGVLQQVETVIAATSCSQSTGTSDIDVFATGKINKPYLNFVTVYSPGSIFIINATLRPYYKYRGQNITINQMDYGEFNGVELDNFSASASYNSEGTAMTMANSVDVFNINGGYDPYQGRLSNDYYRIVDNGLPYIMGWGLQTYSRANYPTQEYWQRSKVLREDSRVLGRTVIVKDRIIGANTCRIVIDLFGDNNADYFWQSGTLTISDSIPSDPVYEFNF